jgi:hypothetical protein
VIEESAPEPSRVMLDRFDEDARRRVIALAAEESKRRGDDRIGTEHLLLASSAIRAPWRREPSTWTSIALEPLWTRLTRTP